MSDKNTSSSGDWRDLVYIDGYLSPQQRANSAAVILAQFDLDHGGSLEEVTIDVVTDLLLNAELNEPGSAERIVYYALIHCRAELDGSEAIANGFAQRKGDE